MVHFTLQSNALNHAFQSVNFTIEEFNRGSLRLDAYLQRLAEQLNSNQHFEADDTFTMESTFIPLPGRGSGRKRIGSRALDKLLPATKFVVTIKNAGELCCARAIVTMRAFADQGARGVDYDNLQRGLPIQGRLAKELHQLAGVPEGPCGLAELQKFQSVFPDYQIKVVSVNRPHGIIFKGPPVAKHILLIKADNHYHECNSFSGFLSKWYYCHDCDRGYDHEDIDHHPCEGRYCHSCEKKIVQTYN